MNSCDVSCDNSQAIESPAADAENPQLPQPTSQLDLEYSTSRPDARTQSREQEDPRVPEDINESAQRSSQSQYRPREGPAQYDRAPQETQRGQPMQNANYEQYELSRGRNEREFDHLKTQDIPVRDDEPYWMQPVAMEDIYGNRWILADQEDADNTKQVPQRHNTENIIAREQGYPPNAPWDPRYLA